MTLDELNARMDADVKARRDSMTPEERKEVSDGFWAEVEAEKAKMMAEREASQQK